MIDSHAHLTAKAYRKDLEAVLERARDAGVKSILTVGFDMASSEAGVRLAEKHPDIYAAVGIHPHDATTLNLDALGRLEELASSPKVVAIGEIGLDFYRDLSPRRTQEDAFRLQIGLAKDLELPIIVHDRDAHQRTVQVLREERVSRGVLHCFSGDLNLARQGAEIGLYISFAGVPHRGKRNEPAYVRYVLARVAQVLNRPIEDVDNLTEQNTRSLFNLRELTG
jgi:TatD DNase family protein